MSKNSSTLARRVDENSLVDMRLAEWGEGFDWPLGQFWNYLSFLTEWNRGTEDKMRRCRHHRHRRTRLLFVPFGFLFAPLFVLLGHAVLANL